MRGRDPERRLSCRRGSCCGSSVIGWGHASTCSGPGCTNGTSASPSSWRSARPRCSTDAGRGFGTLAVAAAGVLLIAKDWRDLVPSKRDTAAWRLGLHMEPLPLRAVQRADPLPKLVALTAVLAGFVNLAAAVRPNIAWRNHLLLGVEPLEGLKISHAAAVPTSLLLLVTAPYLWRRRQSALRLALVLLTGLTALDLLKGLDLEAASGSAAAATVLWLGRGSFYVRHDPVTMRVALRRVPLLAGTVAVLCGDRRVARRARRRRADHGRPRDRRRLPVAAGAACSSGTSWRISTRPSASPA